MIQDTLANIAAATIVTFSAQLVTPAIPAQVLASQEISLENRYPVKSVSDVMRDNILLNLSYMDGKIKSRNEINWDEIKKPFTIQFKLDPGQAFAFHDDILKEYEGKIVKTTQAHFNAQEGFKSDGYLFGDGVCHLASLIYWVAKDANLDAKAPTNHDFMAIPEIEKQNGVSIYSNPYSKGSNPQQNLYITNTKGVPVTFKFEYNGEKLKLAILEVD